MGACNRQHGASQLASEDHQVTQVLADRAARQTNATQQAYWQRSQ